MFSGAIKSRMLIASIRLLRDGASFELLLDRSLRVFVGCCLSCSGVSMTVTKCCVQFVEVET